MNRRAFLRTAGLGAAAVLAGCRAAASRAAAPAKRPNLIVIMSDDMGFSDLGCYGGEIATPTLNGLAAKGVRFTQFYNTARCCPTRASLLTGLYQHQAGIGHMMGNNNLPGFQGDLGTNCVTMAEALRPAGYGTYMTGKWHVTPYRGPDTPKHNWPCQRGFDRYFGTIHGAGSFYDPNGLTRDNEFIPPGSDDFYYTDAISDNAATYIRDHRREKPQAPFFMYVAYTAAHWPMHARPEDIAKYKGRYDAGWQAVRQARYQRMRRMGLLKEQWDLSPRDAELWENVSPEDRAWHIRRMEVYAAMVTVMDEGIGRIVQALKDTGAYENTLILFLQDNGGCAEEFGSQGEPRNNAKNVKAEPMAPGELQTQMVPPVTRDGKPVRVGHGVMPGPADTYIAYGKEWANVSNTPFRLYKHWVHEGGIATPLIAHWPAGIPESRHGAYEPQPGHLIDIMATCVDLAGAAYPKTFKGKEITPMQGVSLAPAFSGKDLGRPGPIYWEHEGNRAVRDGKWKLVAKGAAGDWELYDMEADRSELHNLADQHPDRVKEMAERWETFARQAHMIPWPWKGKYAAPKDQKGKKP
ncbi:MAG: arylsulfatase [Planctomycetes bacterium]|nr:arylsulfatase [Planctomycetota bacterium]